MCPIDKLEWYGLLLFIVFFKWVGLENVIFSVTDLLLIFHIQHLARCNGVSIYVLRC